MNRFFKPLAITGLLVLTGLLAFGCGQKDETPASQEELDQMFQELEETTQMIEDNEENMDALLKESEKLEDL